jgi:tRNA pseudouridine55 synthase
MNNFFGFLNIYKPTGMTSHDVVAKVRRALGVKQVGHTGTLDPFAEGVLPIAVGKATRLIEFLDDDKEYLATVQFGAATTTYDLEGEVTFTSDKGVNENEILAALNDFRGEIMQTPPMFSAIKVGGKKLYDYARKGETIEVEPRRVVVDVKLVRFHPHPTPPPSKGEGASAEILVKCSKGTYIRSIAHDLGEELGVGAHLTKLVRTKAGMFNVEDARGLDDLQLIDPLDVLPQPRCEITPDEAQKVKHGQFLLNKGYKDGETLILIYNESVAAVASASENKLLVKKVLI